MSHRSQSVDESTNSTMRTKSSPVETANRGDRVATEQPRMPTLVETDPSSSEPGCVAGKTAETADMLWIGKEFGATNTDLDDSTLSGSFLAGALEDAMKTQALKETNEKEESQSEMMQDSIGSRTLDESDFDVGVSSPREDPGSHESERNENNNSEQRRVVKEGPMEREYVSKYQKFIRDRITDFRNRHPGSLPDYRSMSSHERSLEQKRVLKLLQRLDEVSADEVKPSTDRATNDFQSQSRSSQLPSSYARGEEFNQGDDSMCGPADESTVLQSPVIDRSSNSASLEKSMALLTPLAGDSSGTALRKDPVESSSASPMEVARSLMQYDSPTTESDQLRKRLATTSGKRGADLTRARVDRGSFDGYNGIDDDESSSDMLETSVRNLTLGDSKIFSSSQSPIPLNASEFRIGEPMSPESLAPHPGISFDEQDDSEESTSAPNNDTIEESMIQDRKVRWNLHDESQRDSFINVSLKAGEIAHYRPLAVEHHRRRRAPPTQTFPDPLEGYVDRTRRRMNRLYRWIRRRDENDDKYRSGLVLSLVQQQVADIALKLIIDTYTTPTDESLDRTGNTLIVARSKEDLEEWGRVLREKSSLSVLNHSTLPLKERKSHVTAAKCSHFDVVLTTFDAMKAPDSNVTTDARGIASTKNQTGWFNSRSCSQSETLDFCKRLSVLHQLHWRRIVLVDVCGKKCYLAKPGTSRATAARALSSDSRFLFVVGCPAQGSSLSALAKSDKGALGSIKSILHLDDVAQETSLEASVADFKDSRTFR